MLIASIAIVKSSNWHACKKKEKKCTCMYIERLSLKAHCRFGELVLEILTAASPYSRLCVLSLTQMSQT